MHWRPWFTGKYFILVLVGISHILSSLSSSFHQTVGPRNGWGEGGRVSFCFLPPGNAARVFLQLGPRGQRLSRRGGAAAGVARGRGLTTGQGLPTERGRGLSSESDPRASLRLAAGSAARGDRGGGQSRMLAGSVRLQPLSSLAPRHLAPAGEGDPAALCPRTPRSVSGHLRGEGEAGVPERPDSRPPPDRTAEPFPASAALGTRGEWGPRRGKEWLGHRRWARRPGAWALNVSSCWLSWGLSEARACRAAKKFGNFSRGAWWDLSRGCRIHRGQVRRGPWERAGSLGTGWGVRSADPALLKLSEWPFVGEVDLSGPPTAHGASRRRAVWPSRVQRSSGSSMTPPAAEPSSGRSLPARLP